MFKERLHKKLKTKFSDHRRNGSALILGKRETYKRKRDKKLHLSESTQSQASLFVVSPNEQDIVNIPE